MESDYYVTLQVDPGASSDDIKRAYRKQALLYHPDKNQSASAPLMLTKVQEAYATLSDFQKRREYDLVRGRRSTRFASAKEAKRKAASKVKSQAQIDADRAQFEEDAFTLLSHAFASDAPQPTQAKTNGIWDSDLKGSELHAAVADRIRLVLSRARSMLVTEKDVADAERECIELFGEK